MNPIYYHFHCMLGPWSSILPLFSITNETYETCEVEVATHG